MAGNDNITPSHVQFADGIHPAKKRISPVPSLEKELDIDDEERARRIADEDFNHKKKQVWVRDAWFAWMMLICLDLQRFHAGMVELPEHWYHLWRYR